MLRKDLGNNDSESNKLRENTVFPIIQRIVIDLEQEGWYCVVGDEIPYNIKESLENSTYKENKPYCFTSLQIVDIEHRLVQYVYVFLQDKTIRVVGDENSRIEELSVELNRADEELEEAIRKVIDLGVWMHWYVEFELNREPTSPSHSSPPVKPGDQSGILSACHPRMFPAKYMQGQA